jgi:uncharacterized delta-60 repeat protein
MRIRVSPTPSNTPSYTPTITPTNTECPIGCFDVLNVCCEVETMSINPISGDLLVGGNIDNYGFYPIDTAFKLEKTGNLDISFNPSQSFTARSIFELPDGKVLIAGRSNILIDRFTSTGSIDGTFTQLPLLWTGTTNTPESNAFAIQPDGKILVGGQFNVVSGNSYSRICRINANGTLDTSFNVGTGFNNGVTSITIQPDGKILCTGSFETYSGFSSSGIIRLNSDGSIDSTFTSPVPVFRDVYSLLLLPSGKIMCQVNDVIRRLNSDGSIDGSFAAVTLSPVSFVYSYDIEPFTNKVFAAGDFTTINGSPKKGLVKINTDGSIDNSLDIGTGFGSVFFYFPRVVKRKYNGHLYVGGNFDNYKGIASVNRFTELLPNGDVFECEVGTCYQYSISKLDGFTSGTALIIDCNGLIREIVNNDTLPYDFCASKILNTNSSIVSGGTDVAEICCFEFENINPTFNDVSVGYISCDTNIRVNQNVIPGARFCAKSIVSMSPITRPIRQIGSCVLPTPTPTNTSTPTRTPAVTPTMTPTNTQTQTQTPSPTPCYQPKAYILFDSQTGSTALNTWMASQGSAFRGMFINGPSLVPATFEEQMNAYISYSGFGPSQYYALLPQNITPNQDPIIWNEVFYPTWEGTFVWVNMFVPTCPICPEGEYGLMGANGFAIHTTNDFRRSIPFYYSGTAIPQGFYRLYTTYAGTDMRLSASGSEYILGSLDCGITPTPSPTRTSTATPTNTQTSTPTGTPPSTPTQTQTPSPSGGITCIQVIDTVIAPEPQTGINNFFGVNISLSPYPVTENVTVTGYIRDDGNISNTYDFSITVIGGTQSGETANNVLTTGPADTATIFITGITPSVVTYDGNSVYICGLEPEPTPTMTPTPSTTPPCTNTIFTHGALRVTCSDFCNTNYLIGTTDCATETYFNLSIGDFIYGYSGQSGYLAYSNVSTDTNTGPFRIAEIDGSGEILGLYVCSGGSCIPL